MSCLVDRNCLDSSGFFARLKLFSLSCFFFTFFIYQSALTDSHRSSERASEWRRNGRSDGAHVRRTDGRGGQERGGGGIKHLDGYAGAST